MVAVPLVFLASFSFKYNTPDSFSQWNGFLMAMIALSIIMLFVVFRIVEGIKDILLVRGKMEHRVKSRFTPLLILLILVPAINYRAISNDTVTDMYGKIVPRWDFQWGSGTHNWEGVLICFFLGFLFLHKILLIIREVLRTANHQLEDEIAAK